MCGVVWALWPAAYLGHGELDWLLRGAGLLEPVQRDLQPGQHGCARGKGQRNGPLSSATATASGRRRRVGNDSQPAISPPGCARILSKKSLFTTSGSSYIDCGSCMAEGAAALVSDWKRYQGTRDHPVSRLGHLEETDALY